MSSQSVTVGEPLLVAERVRKVYQAGGTEVTAIADLDLVVRRGELVAVMGPSGSGKTTLLNCLSGIDEVSAGRVLVGGQDLSCMSDTQRSAYRSREVGFVFQAFNLVPVLNAVENVELPLLLAGLPIKLARSRAMEMLDRVGLIRRALHLPAELSGGELQRAAVARALVTHPTVVWADEPTGNLDTRLSGQITDLLRDLNCEYRQTIIVITHDPSVGASADRLIQMRDGRIVRDAPTRPALPRGQDGCTQA